MSRADTGFLVQDCFSVRRLAKDGEDVAGFVPRRIPQILSIFLSRKFGHYLFFDETRPNVDDVARLVLRRNLRKLLDKLAISLRPFFVL